MAKFPGCVYLFDFNTFQETNESLRLRFRIPPPFKGGVGGLNTEIFHFGGGHPPTPRNMSAKNVWFLMVSPGPG